MTCGSQDHDWSVRASGPVSHRECRKCSRTLVECESVPSLQDEARSMIKGGYLVMTMTEAATRRWAGYWAFKPGTWEQAADGSSLGEPSHVLTLSATADMDGIDMADPRAVYAETN